MKKEQFEQVAKWGGGIAVVLLAGGVALMLLKSMLAIAACGLFGLAAINVWPVAVTRLANWKYNQLRQQAINNPIPTLLRQLEVATETFRTRRQGVVKFSTTTKNFKEKLDLYANKGSDVTSMQAMYENMKRALAIQIHDLGNVQTSLAEFKEKISEAQDAYNMALDMQSANQDLEAFTGQPAQDFAFQREAFDAITSKLNEGFARMEVSLALDYNKLPAAMLNDEVLDFKTLNNNLKATEFA